MGIPNPEFVQTPRDGAVDITHHVTGQPDVERSMLAYAKRAHILISTSLPEGMKKTSRFLHPRAFFSPVTWSQQAKHGRPHSQHDMLSNYSFPNFKEHTDIMGSKDQNEQANDNALQLFIGSDHLAFTQRPVTVDESRPFSKPMPKVRKTKLRLTMTMTNAMTSHKKKTLVNTMKTSEDNIGPVSKDIPAAATSDSSPRSALDVTGKGTAIAMSNDVNSGSLVFPSISAHDTSNTHSQRGAHGLSRLHPTQSMNPKLPQIDNKWNLKHNCEPTSNIESLPVLIIGKNEAHLSRTDRHRAHDGKEVRKVVKDASHPAVAVDNGGQNNVQDGTKDVTSISQAALKPVNDTHTHIGTDYEGGQVQPLVLVSRRGGFNKTVMQPSVVNLGPYKSK